MENRLPIETELIRIKHESAEEVMQYINDTPHEQLTLNIKYLGKCEICGKDLSDELGVEVFTVENCQPYSINESMKIILDMPMPGNNMGRYTELKDGVLGVVIENKLVEKVCNECMLAKILGLGSLFS